MGAEIGRLTSGSRVEEASVLKEASAEQLLEKEKGKTLIISFVKAAPEEKFHWTSETFKTRGPNVESLRNIFNKESYYTIGFQEVTLFDEKMMRALTVKANLSWFAEGYDGIQTFYFMLVKERDTWTLDWLVY